MDIFNVEEINLMCVYDTSERERLIAEMRESLSAIYEPEILEIMQSAIHKLERMTDEEYAEIGFFIADDFDDLG